VFSDQIGVESLTFGLEVDPIVHEELGPVSAGRIPIDELSVGVAPHPVS
jgi:hypothetical protein